MACARYDNDLSAHAYDGIPLTSALEQRISVRLAANLLKPKEHALLTFGEVSSARLVCASLAHLRASPSRAIETLQEAQKLQIATYAISGIGVAGGIHEVRATISSRAGDKQGTGSVSHYNKRGASGLALVQALADYHRIDIQEIPPYKQTVVEPQKALEQHIKEFGGPAISSQQFRTETLGIIKHRYQHEFEDRLFYFKPIEALKQLYSQTPKWTVTQDIMGWHCSGLIIPRYDQAGARDEYSLSTRGPNKQAAQAAAARLVLNHLGATDKKALAKR